nr:reverse transcriptase domain-containing protein [Tanacetum cinerariifolium]
MAYEAKYKEVCDILKNMFSMHLKEVEHPRAKDVLNKKPTILRPKWGTKENNTDYHNKEKKAREALLLEAIRVKKHKQDSKRVAIYEILLMLSTGKGYMKLQLNELNELRDQAYENSLIYKERTKKLHDFKIKNRIFNVGDQVLLFKSRLKIFSRKLKTRWSGPFTIAQVFPYGTFELSQPDGPNFKVNGHHVKHYFGGDIPSKFTSYYKVIGWCVPNTPSHGADPSTYVTIIGSSGLRRFFRYAMLSIHSIYVMSLYPFTERYAQPYFFSCFIRQMVNTRTDADLSAAVQNALQTLLPQIRAEIREEFRTSSGPSDAGGNPPPFQTFKTLCLLNYALMIRHDYDLTSSLRRGALHSLPWMCLSPKSTGFNEFSSNIATVLLWVNSPSFTGRIVPLFDSMLVHQGKGSGTLTEPHHTPYPAAQQSPQHDLSSLIHPPVTTTTIPTIIPTDIPTLRQYFRKARIARSSALSTATDEPASPLKDDSQGEAFHTIFGLEAKQDRENIIKTSALPYDSPPRVTSIAADEGSMQHKLYELTDLCTRLQRQQTEMASKIVAQELEITNLKARIKLLQDKDGGGAEPSGEDTTIKGRSLETGEEAGVEKSTERGSNDTKELVNVLTSLDTASILTSEVQVVSVPPAAEFATISVPSGSGLVPTASPIFTIASVVNPYARRKGKEKMVESDTPKKKKLQEQIDVQVAREMEEQMAREDQRRSEQIARDAEITRIHAEEELQMLIDGLDRNNETISKYMQEYEQFAADLSIREKIDMINELVKYQDHYAKIEDFVPMASKEEGERVKRKGLRLEQDSAKRMKAAEEVSEEDLKAMMQLVLVEEVYVEALQVKHPIIDWEIHTKGQRNYWKIIRLGGSTVVYQFFVDMLKHFDREDLTQLWTLVRETLSIRQAISDKEKELWVELKRLYDPDVEDQLWTHTQALMHDPVKWRLYDTCGVHHVLFKDQEIFMLVKKDYPLRKGLAIVVISNKLQVENYSQMASDLIQKIHKIANSPRQRDD